MGPGGPGGPRKPNKEFGKPPYELVERPKNLKDVPRYCKQLLGGFFERLFYIFKLVWETDPRILFFLMLVTVFNGVFPVVGSLITQRLLNELQRGYIGDVATLDAATFMTTTLFVLLVVLFAYRILNTVVSSINSIVTRIAGERVVHHVKHMSPSVAARAFLQSIIPAPVISLNSFTIAAVTAAMFVSSN